MELAFYRKEEGRDPTLMDLIDELDVFAKEPIKTVHEVLMDLSEKGEIGGGRAFDSALTTLWAALMSWEGIEKALRSDSREARGIPENDFEPETTEEKRYILDLETRIAILPEHLRAYLFILMHPEEQRTEIIKKLKQECDKVEETVQ